MARLAKKKINAASYTGDIDASDRTVLENSFQRGEIQVMVGTTLAMYQGITLTAGNHQWWNSLPWNPEIRRQGEDRMNRIGQQTTVMIHVALPPNTVSTTKVEPKLNLKSRIVSSVLPQDAIQEGISG
jgi:SNF2 family DNA or RNA helicase